jgi:tetratricopeptide (TPR) repeat protein
LFALSDYERALRFKHPDLAKVHYGSATTYLALKRPLDAKREFSAALNFNPDFGQARAQLVMLGDENAKLQTAEADPILTGSVGVYGGGTVANKPGLPAAVEVPATLEASIVDTPTAKNKKSQTVTSGKILDRLTPEKAEALAVAQVTATNDEVAIEQVPAIPEAVAVKVKPAAVKLAAVVAESEEIQDTDAPAITGWAVQISSADSEDGAWSTWKKLQSRHKVLKDKKPNVVKADLGNKGVFYRVRLGGFDEQASAKQACAKLKAGGVSCYISKAGG